MCLLCSNTEKSLKPNVAKLQEIGFSVEEIPGIISRSPSEFLFNFVPKIDFWMKALGSVENLSVVLKRCASILHMDLEKIVVPILSFLQEQCCRSPTQIVQLIKSGPRLITCNTQ
jgi:hypothetical protein